VPTLVLRTTAGCGSRQLFTRNVFRSVFRSKKLAGISADDLVFGIPEYVLGADIPVGDTPSGSVMKMA
jgi:hypothetical protein